MPRKALALALIAAAGLAGCGGAAPQGAAESASRLLAAALKGDRAAFEAQIDRAAVREDVRRQVSQVAQGATLDVDGGPSEFALDRMIGPQAVRVVHAGSGAPLTRAPSAGQVAPLMKMTGQNRACLHDAAQPDACLLTFAKAHGDWRLVGMKAMGLKVEVAGD